jgi:hypothetical protein
VVVSAADVVPVAFTAACCADFADAAATFAAFAA